MTIDEFAEEVRGNMEPPPGYQFDPITIAILMTVITTIVGHYVEKWLERCEAKNIRNPSKIQRTRLRLRVDSTFVMKAPRLAYQFSTPVYQALLKTLASKSDEQVGATLTAFRTSLGKTS